jgi:hypothetical protein
MGLSAGDLVVVKTHPQSGVGRLERLMNPQGECESHLDATIARIFFYDTGIFQEFSVQAIAPAPPGAPRHMHLHANKTQKEEDESEPLDSRGEK